MEGYVMKHGAIFIAMFLSLFVIVAAVHAAESEVSVSVVPAVVKSAHGEKFTVEICMDTRDKEVYAAQFTLLFDSEILNVTSLKKGDLLSGDGNETLVVREDMNNTLGKVEYGEMRLGEGGVSGKGTLASVSFEVVGNAGRSALKLSDVHILSPDLDEIDFEIQHGECIVGNATAADVMDITVEEAYEMMREHPEDFILLDVRTEHEYESEHIYMRGVEVLNIPLNELEKRVDELKGEKKIIVYSSSGDISRSAASKLAEKGFTVYNMLGGIGEWRIHYDITHPDTTIQPLHTPEASHAATPRSSPHTASHGLEAFALSIVILIMKRRLRTTGTTETTERGGSDETGDETGERNRE